MAYNYKAMISSSHFPQTGYFNNSSQTNEIEYLVVEFLRGPLTQREERSLKPDLMLDMILSGPNAREIAQQLNPQKKYHHKIVRNDQIGSLLGQQDLADAFAMIDQGTAKDSPADQPMRDFFIHYMHSMSPFIVRILEDTQDPNSSRKQLPQGLMEGLQGQLNLFILIQDAIENKLQLTKEEVAKGIVENQFTATFFQPLGLGGALMTSYANSPARMMLSFLRNHPNDEWRQYFKDLELRHFNQVDNLWISNEIPPNTKGWKQNNISLVWVNFGEARLAVREVIHNRCGFEFDYKGPIDVYIKAMEETIQTLTQREFDDLPGRYGRTYAALRHSVYQSSLPHMIIDFLRHNPKNQVRLHFRRLMPYHFPSVPKTNQVDYKKLKSYEQMAFEELFDILTDQKGKYGWSYAEIPALITAKTILETPLRFGATAQIFVVNYKSFTDAVMNALKSHSNPSHRRLFSKLRHYHFKNTPHDLWSMDPSIMPDPPYSGWEYCNETKRWKNLPYARIAMDEFMERILETNHSWEWNLERVVTKLTLPEIQKNKIRYNADIRSMVRNVYFDSAREAILDYIQCDLFNARVQSDPKLAKEISKKWGTIEGYIEFAKETLQNRRGHRQLSMD